MSSPIVSIILPAFNRLQYLRPAVESVLAQTFSDWELIIVDDGSSEPTRSYLGTLEHFPGVRVILLPHSGNPGAVRNVALRAARGEYVAFMDSDDLWYPQKLQMQLAALRASPTFQWSYTALTRVDEHGAVLPTEADRHWVAHAGHAVAQLLKFEAIVATPTVMVSRRLVMECGGFDEELRMYEDYDLWLRLALSSEVVVVPHPLAHVRNHSEHYSSGGISAAAARRQLLNKMFGVITDRQLRTVVRAEQAKNAATLAYLYAADGDARSMLRTAASSLRYSWWRARWWINMVCALLRMGLPHSWISSFRRYRLQKLGLQRPGL